MMTTCRNSRLIRTREEYDRERSSGKEPLIDPFYDVEISLRVSIQTELFGKGHTPAENEKFYRWCWEHYPHYCQETIRPLREYSAVYVSHILTRGAHPQMAHDPRNVNILCFEMHNKWENGRRETMRIFRRNQKTIEKLKREYSSLL